jgi:hypothetical protein
MRKLSLLLFAFLGISSLFAQSGAVGSGGDATNSSGSISFSLGQIDYAAAANGTGAINAGVQQPYEVFVSSVDAAMRNAIIDVFPNPTEDFINLRIDELKNGMHFLLNDLNGKIISAAEITSQLSSLDMKQFPPAVYLLQILDAENNVKTFKIIKK